MNLEMDIRIFWGSTLCAVASLSSGVCVAHSDLAHHLPTIKIQAKTHSSDSISHPLSASEGIISQETLSQQPLLRPADILENIPGLVVTQHSGAGKANQYFLRGFNLDHGTDFATLIDGIPLNMVSHAHGQGYTDLNFLIPELIDSIHYHKGPTAIAVGDFASAGSAEIQTISSVDRPILQVTGGSDDYWRVFGLSEFSLLNGSVITALENITNNGPWQQEENLSKHNLFIKYLHGDHLNGWQLGFQHTESTWTATDQIPERLIVSGQVDRYGSLNPTDGGQSKRTALWFENKQSDQLSSHLFQAHAIYNRLNLFSDFTYFLTDPLRGDQFEQSEKRIQLGSRYQYHWQNSWNEREILNSFGSSFRFDQIDDLGLFQTQKRQRFQTLRVDQVEQSTFSAWLQQQMTWQPWLRSIIALRGDYFHFDVESDTSANSGKENEHIFSPKFGLVLGPWKNTEYFLNYSYGFHSNDARGTTTQVNTDRRDPDYLQITSPVSPLVQTKTFEMGLHHDWPFQIESIVSLWQQDSASELVFVGDAGTTEASRPSHRYGLEMSHIYTPNDNWRMDLDYAWTKARFRDAAAEGRYIPGAIQNMASASVQYTSDQHWNIAANLRYIGPRPLIEDNSVQSKSSTLVNLKASYQFSPSLQSDLEILNLLDRRVNDIEYYYASCTNQDQNDACPTQGNGEGILDKHLHPTAGRNFRLSIRYLF